MPHVIERGSETALAAADDTPTCIYNEMSPFSSSGIRAHSSVPSALARRCSHSGEEPTTSNQELEPAGHGDGDIGVVAW